VEDKFFENNVDYFSFKEYMNFSDMSLEDFLKACGPIDDGISCEASVFPDSLHDINFNELVLIS